MHQQKFDDIFRAIASALHQTAVAQLNPVFSRTVLGASLPKKAPDCLLDHYLSLIKNALDSQTYESNALIFKKIFSQAYINGVASDTLKRSFIQFSYTMKSYSTGTADYPGFHFWIDLTKVERMLQHELEVSYAMPRNWAEQNMFGYASNDETYLQRLGIGIVDVQETPFSASFLYQFGLALGCIITVSGLIIAALAYFSIIALPSGAVSLLLAVTAAVGATTVGAYCFFNRAKELTTFTPIDLNTESVKHFAAYFKVIEAAAFPVDERVEVLDYSSVNAV